MVLNASSILADIASAITLSSTSGDIIPPLVSSVLIINTTTFKIVFSETVGAASAQNTANYTGLGSVSSAILSGGDTVTLVLASVFPAGQNSTLTISGVADIAGNIMTTYNYSFIYNNTIGHLVISEIMYNDPGAGTDSLEFIELYNNDTVDIELGGYNFSTGITYEFPPATLSAGGILVLSRFPLVADSFFGITSTSWTSGTLDNTGELIVILNTTGDTIDVVQYDEASAWPTEPNGTGPSLILCDPSSDNNDPSSWSHSTNLAGVYQGVNIYANPGYTDVCAPPNTPPLITGITITPATPSTSDTIIVSAIVTDNGAVSSVSLYWGTNGASFPFTFNMILTNGNVFTCSSAIPAQAAGTTVYYYILASDDQSLTTTSPTASYIISSVGPATHTETFTNLGTVSSYSDGSFTGDGGIVWHYIESRDDAGYQITGPGLLLRRLSGNSMCYSQPVTGGISSFSVDLKKAYTGAGNRQAEVFINNNSIGTSVAFDDNIVHTFTANNLNITGNIEIKVTNITEKQVVIDNITWTGYAGAANIPPLITNVITYPFAPVSSDSVIVTAEITDDSYVDNVTLFWGTNGTDFPNNINMILTIGNVFTTSPSIPAQSAGSTIYYYIVATDDGESSTTSTVLSYYVAIDNSLPVTQTINLPSGWSIFSTYLDPVEANIDSVMHSIIAGVIIVKSGSGQVFWPQYSVNQIGNMVIGQGYQTKALSAITLNITGDAVVPENTPLNLPAGWSIIAYLRQSAAPITLALDSIVSDILLVKNGAGLVYWPYYGLNGIGNMIPGQGYQINLNSAVTLIYPSNSAVFKELPVVSHTTRHFGVLSPTGNNMILGVDFKQCDYLERPFLSELGVFDINGLLVGSCLVKDIFNAVTIWGDDNLTVLKDGLYENEPFTILLWDPETGVETALEVKSWEAGDEFYQTDKICVTGEIAAVTSTGDNILRVSQYPAFGNIFICLTLTRNENVKLSMYNSAGCHTSLIFSGNLSAGTHIINEDISGYSDGIFILKITSPSFTIVRKLIILK
jgi:hypothetical protein